MQIFAAADTHVISYFGAWVRSNFLPLAGDFGRERASGRRKRTCEAAMSDLPGSPNCDSLERRCAAAETLLATLNREHLEEIGAVQAMGLVLHFCSARNGRGPLPLYGGLALHLLCCCTGNEPVYTSFDQLDCDALSFQFGADAVEISQERPRARSG